MSASSAGNSSPLPAAASHRRMSTDIAPRWTGPRQCTRSSLTGSGPAWPKLAIPASQAACDARVSELPRARPASRVAAAAAQASARTSSPINMPAFHRRGGGAVIAVGPRGPGTGPGPGPAAGPLTGGCLLGTARPPEPEDVIADLVDGVIQP